MVYHCTQEIKDGKKHLISRPIVTRAPDSSTHTVQYTGKGYPFSGGEGLFIYKQTDSLSFSL